MTPFLSAVCLRRRQFYSLAGALGFISVEGVSLRKEALMLHLHKKAGRFDF